MYDERKGFDGHAIVHLLGHRSVAGHVSVVQLGMRGEGGFGTCMLRVRFPAVDGCDTHEKFYSFNAVYSVEPCSDDEAARYQQSGINYRDSEALPAGARFEARERAPDDLPF